MIVDLDAARRDLAEAAVGRILGGVSELCEMGAIMPGPIADSFAAIGKALHAGKDPMEVAVVCFATASALRNPDDSEKIQRSATDTLAEMQHRNPEGP